MHDLYNQSYHRRGPKTSKYGASMAFVLGTMMMAWGIYLIFQYVEPQGEGPAVAYHYGMRAQQQDMEWFQGPNAVMESYPKRTIWSPTTGPQSIINHFPNRGP